MGTDMTEVGRKKLGFGYMLMVLAVVVLGAVCLAPLYWMLTGSFKEMSSSMKIPPELIPIDPIIDNYRFLFEGTFPVLKWLWNSLVIASGTTLFCVLVCTMMGYAFSKKEFAGKKLLFFSILVTMMLPKQATLIPLFITIKNFGLIDNPLGAIIPLIVWPYGIFMMRQFIHNVPNDLIEAATIDGASEISIFKNVIVPLAKPSISALGVIMFLNAWNDFMWQLIVLKKTANWTINLGVSVISRNPVGASPVIDYGLAMAGGTLGALPVIILFIMLQKYFVKGLTMGAVKE